MSLLFRKHTRLLVVTIAALLAACTSMGTPPDYSAALASSSRMEGDQARDAGRKPAEVLAFLGVRPGMTVLDVMASGGWYTEVMAIAVGNTGKVYAQNPPAFLAFRNGFYDKAISARLADGRLPNVERLDADFAAMNLDGTVDVAISALNFHDLYNRDPAAAAAMLSAVMQALRPGGVFGIIDHVGNPGANNAALHRMLPQQAMDAAMAAGFTVESSDLLAVSTDDHTKMVFAPDVQGQTDRFLLKLRKPG
ncbi:MAG: class I SAM-dependent methyltransferase [Pseudomonadota bacterium]